MPSQSDDKRQAAREVIDILHEISTLLVCEPFILSRGVVARTAIVFLPFLMI